MARRKQRFRKVSRYVWRDPRFKQAGSDGQLLFLYLWTGPESNASGILSASPVTIGAALGWHADRAAQALQTLENVGLANVDSEADVVALVLLDFDPPDSSKVVTHWGVCIAELPPSPVIALALARLEAHCERRGGAFVKAFTAMRAELPGRFDTLTDRVSDTVSDRVSPKDTYKETRNPHLYQRLESSPVKHAREGQPDPEPIGGIIKRMAQGDGL